MTITEPDTADPDIADPESTRRLLSRVQDSARLALTRMGMTPVSVLESLPTLTDRPHRQVVRCVVAGAHGRDEVAVKVVLDPGPAAVAAFDWEHALARDLSGTADALVLAGALPRNPIVQVLHPAPILVGTSLVAVTRFVPGHTRPLSARAWGETLGMLHRIGSTERALALLSTHRATNVLFGLTAQALLQALARPGHPFGGDPGLVLTFVRVLRERALQALDLDPQPLLVHRDFHALNCINASTGAVAIDWQDAGWGNRSDDFAWMHLAVRRFGRPASILETAKRAYAAVTGGICPTGEQIHASGHLLELLCLGFSLQHADRSLEHLRECRRELPILRDPHASTGRWRMLHNPKIFAPGVVA